MLCLPRARYAGLSKLTAAAALQSVQESDAEEDCGAGVVTGHGFFLLSGWGALVTNACFPSETCSFHLAL